MTDTPLDPSLIDRLQSDREYAESQLRQYRQAQARIDELEIVCGQAYQVLGHFMELLPDAKMLDNLDQARLVHDDVLPFTPKTQSIK